MASPSSPDRPHDRLRGGRLSRLARRLLLGGVCALAAGGLARAQTNSHVAALQSRSQTNAPAPVQTRASTWGGAKLLNVQAQIVPLSDNSLANASAGFLPTPVPIARTPGQAGVMLWDEIHIRPPAVSSANGVVTITINGK